MRVFVAAVVCAAALGAQTLQETVERAALSAQGIKPDQLAITAVDLNGPKPVFASYHGAESFYPASVVKLFYLVATHAAMEAGKIQDTPELDRALHDMIVSSSNDATQLVFSTLTGTTGGPELTDAELKPWLAKREVVNRYFDSLGYTGINVNQPTFAEDPYGRERQARGPNFENNNRLTTDVVARLWLSIVKHQAVSAARSDQMLALLHRDPFAPGSKDEQATDFGGKTLPVGSQYWSKAGWTSTARHDSAYVRLPNGSQYIFVAFTRGVATDMEILPFLHRQIADYFMKQPTNAVALSNPAKP
jgi:beta-lactamase class A